MPRKLIEITAEIIQAQAGHTAMTTTEVTDSLRQVFSALQEIQRAENSGTELTSSETHEETSSSGKPAITPKNSIQKDKVICLECGAEMKLITVKHLTAHGLSLKEYKKKYGFPIKTPLACKALTQARSKQAKKRGLPEKLQQYLEGKQQSKAGVETPSVQSGPGAEQVKQVRARQAKSSQEAVETGKPKQTRLRKKKMI